MAPDGSPLALLAQQGAEAANLVVAEKSIGVPRREPSGGLLSPEIDLVNLG
jgi:hypothetical protein